MDTDRQGYRSRHSASAEVRLARWRQPAAPHRQGPSSRGAPAAGATMVAEQIRPTFHRQTTFAIHSLPVSASVPTIRGRRRAGLRMVSDHGVTIALIWVHCRALTYAARW